MDTAELVGLTSLADDGRTNEMVYGKQRRSKPRVGPGEEDDNDVRLISELTSANLGGHLMPEFKALTKLIRTKLKTDHQARHPLESGRFSDLKIGSHKIGYDHPDRMAGRALANRITDERMINRTMPKRPSLILATWLVIILVSNWIADNRIYAKASADDAPSGQQQPALFFTGNLPAKLAFYNTTGTVLSCPISGVPKPTIYWLAVGGHHSSLNALNGLASKASYRYSSSFNFVNQHWPIGGHYRNHYQQSTGGGGGNPPTANSNLLENVLASNPELSSVVDQHSVIYTRNDGALVFPPFYANDLQPNVHNRKYRCLAINEHGALLSNEIQIKACKYFRERFLL